MSEPNRGYKRSTIEKIINSKIDDWLSTIKHENSVFKDIVKDNILVSGGCIASMLLGEQPNDFDIYFKSIDVAKMVADYYIARLPAARNARVSTIESSIASDNQLKLTVKSSGVASELQDQAPYEYFELTDSSPSNFLDKIFDRFKVNERKAASTKKEYKVAFLTSNAITLTDQIQLIVRFIGQPDEIHKNFDFIHCTNYWTKSTGLVLNLKALEAILSKSLIFNDSCYPLSALFRTKKFLNRGWNITAGQMTKIGYKISQLDLNNMETLREQLVGVDAAYFQEIIRILNEQKDKEIDKTYLFSLIDQVFDT